MNQTPIQAKYQHRMESKAREWRKARMKWDEDDRRELVEIIKSSTGIGVLLFLILFMLGGGCQ